MTTRITLDNISEAALNTIGGGPKVSSIVSTNSTYGALESNTVNATSGGYLKVIGSGFSSPMQIFIDVDVPVLATSITFISSSEIRAEVSAKAAGSYLVYVVRATDGAIATVIDGVTYA